MRNLSIWLTSYNPDMNQKLEGLENCKKLKHLDLYDYYGKTRKIR